MYNYCDIKELLDNSSYFVVGRFPHSYKCFDVTRPCNSAIKSLLEETGYWHFSNRSRKLVYYHQIIAFLFVGKNKMRFSGADVEVHHVDGNTHNNTPSNLVYLSPDDHVLVTKFQRRACTFNIKVFKKYKGARTVFNTKGNKIANWLKFILNIIARSIVATFKFSGLQYVNSITTVFKSVMSWAFKVCTKLDVISKDYAY